MTEPTDADRKHAAELIWGTLPAQQVEAVARALAGVRQQEREDWSHTVLTELSLAVGMVRDRDPVAADWLRARADNYDSTL